MNTASLSRLDTIRGLLCQKEPLMPRKYQNGKLQTRDDVARPYYFIRVTLPVIDGVTGKPTKKRVDEKLGFLDAISRDQAMQLRAQTLELVNAHRTIAQSQITFRDLARRYLDIYVPTLGFGTRKKYQLQIKNHLLPAFGDMRLCEIDRPAVQKFLLSKKDSLGWWSRIDLKGILSGMFTVAQDWKLYEGENPTEKIRIGRKIAVYEKRILTGEQIVAILAALDDELRFLVRMLFGLGLNISEALGLRWSDFDLQAGTVSIRRRWYRGDLSAEGELKTDNRAAVVVMASELRAEVRRRRGALSDFVFATETGNPPDERDLLRERFRPVVKRLGLYYRGFGWQAFRRQNITWRQTVGGATPIEAQKAGRHGSLDMTLLYTLEDPERSRAQVDRMFDKLVEIPRKPPERSGAIVTRRRGQKG